DRHRGTLVERLDLELLLVQARPRAHLDLAAELLGKRGERAARGALEHSADARGDRDRDLPAAEARQVLADLAQELVRHRLGRQHVSAALTEAARLAQLLDEILARSLARHLDEAEFGYLEDVGARLVVAQG